MMRARSVAIVASLSALPFGAMVLAAPAYACTDSDNVNTLCSNEQAFVSDLATYGITPSRSPKDLANLGWQVCAWMSSTSNDGVVDIVNHNNSLSREQSQVIVNVAQNRLC